MPINLTTYLSGQDVTPTEDAIVYEYATNDDGIIFGCDVSQKSDNKIFVASGHGIFHGRKFTVLEETIQVPLTSSASENKKLIVHMDLANQSNPIEFKVQSASKNLIQQDNLNLINGVYELELATFTVTSTAITELKQTFTKLQRGKPTVEVADVVGLDAALKEKANKSHTHTQSQITGLTSALNGKASKSHTHTISDISGLSADLAAKANKSEAQMYKLTKDNGFDTFLDNVNIDSVKKTGLYYINNVVIKGKRYNGYLQVQAHADTYVKQTFTDYQSGVTFVRVLSANSWVEWQKLGGIDAKVYDIVLLNGAKPSKYATENDNKIIRIGDTAYMHARLDLSESRGGSKFYNIAEVPKSVVPKLLKKYSSDHKYLTLGSVMTSKEPNTFHARFAQTGETRQVDRYPNNYGAISFRINSNKTIDSKMIFDCFTSYAENITDFCGYYSWYVGEVN